MTFAIKNSSLISNKNENEGRKKRNEYRKFRNKQTISNEGVNINIYDGSIDISNVIDATRFFTHTIWYKHIAFADTSWDRGYVAWE